MKYIYILIALIVTGSVAQAERGLMWKTDDGGIWILAVPGGMTDEQFEEEWVPKWEKEWPQLDGRKYHFIDQSIRPPKDERIFRAAWRASEDGKSIVIDRDEAAAAMIAELKKRAAVERVKLLDEVKLGQIEGNAAKVEAASDKIQAISDAALDALDVSAEAAPTLADLKALVPEELKK